MPYIAPRPLTIFDLNCDGRPKSATVSNSTEQYDLVFLKALSWSAPISETPTRKFILYLLGCHLESSGQALDYDH
jgi:hypothetical protein